MCGYRTCEEFAAQLPKPDLIGAAFIFPTTVCPRSPKLRRSGAAEPLHRFRPAELRRGRAATAPARSSAVARQPRPRVRFLPGALSRGARSARDHPAAQSDDHPRDGHPGGRHPDRPAAGHVVRLPDHALRRGHGGGPAHRRDRLVRHRPAGPRQKGSRTWATTSPKATKGWSTRPAAR